MPTSENVSARSHLLATESSTHLTRRYVGRFVAAPTSHDRAPGATAAMARCRSLVLVLVRRARVRNAPALSRARGSRRAGTSLTARRRPTTGNPEPGRRSAPIHERGYGRLLIRA